MLWKGLTAVLFAVCLRPRTCLELAIVRPFATDAEIWTLQRSFDVWNTYLPCNTTTVHPVDLFILFSRNLSENADAAFATGRIEADFANQDQAWHSCFRSLYVLSAGLSPEEDIYDPRSADTNPLWVNGPNTVFRHAVKEMRDRSYSSFFFMETDCWPQRQFWLDQFTLETSDVSGTVIRGSRYRGDKWDPFLRQLPEALRLHVNGNAIYNVSHPLMEWLLTQLENDVGTLKQAVAFDVRMMELVLAAREALTNSNLTNFTGVWEEYVPAGTEPYRADSMLVGNYAATLFNASFDGGEFIRHLSVSNVMSELNESKVTLAAAHFSYTNFRFFNDSIGSKHPFRKIVVLTRDKSIQDGRIDVVPTLTNKTNVTWRTALRPGNMSFCELASHVETEFFIYTDTLRTIASPVSLLMADTRPVVGYTEADSKYCALDARCLSDLIQAEELFNVTMLRHYSTFDTLYITSAVNSFCVDWEAAALDLLTRDNVETCRPLKGPTADDYFAWLGTQEPVSGRYKMENKENKGWRTATSLHTAHPPDDRTCGVYKGKEYDWTVNNISGCYVYVEQPDGCASDDRCMWKPMFGSGKCIPSLNTPDMAYTKTTTETTTTQELILPTLAPTTVLFATSTTRAPGTTVFGMKPETYTTTTASTTETATGTTTTETLTTTTQTATTQTATTQTVTTATVTTMTETTTWTTTATDTTTSTPPAAATSDIGSVLIKINATQVRHTVAEVFKSLRTALDNLKKQIFEQDAQGNGNGNGNGDGASASPTTVTSAAMEVEPQLWVELTERSWVWFKEELTASQVRTVLEAIREARCGVLGPDQCDVQEPNSTSGLKAETGSGDLEAGFQRLLLESRNLADENNTDENSTGGNSSSIQNTQATGDNFTVEFEVFTRIDEPADMATMVDMEGADFLPRLQTVLVRALPEVEPPQELAPVQNQALTVLRWKIPEAALEDVEVLQEQLLDVNKIVEAVDVASGGNGEALLLAAPEVDLCMGRTCGGNGQCSAGICTCITDWMGVNCLIPVTTPAPLPVKVEELIPLAAPLLVAAVSGSSWDDFPIYVAASIFGACLCWCGPCCFKFYLWRKKRREDAEQEANDMLDDAELNHCNPLDLEDNATNHTSTPSEDVIVTYGESFYI